MRDLLGIIRSGPALSFQDHGRSGHARFGVPPGGYMDLRAAKYCRSLLDPPADPTLVEIGAGGALFEVLNDCELGHVGGLRCDALPSGRFQYFRAGERLEFAPDQGMWSYLGLNGCWEAPEWLDSRSFHPASMPNDRLTDGFVIRGQTKFCLNTSLGARYLPESYERSKEDLVIHRGPHSSQFSPTVLKQLVTQEWRIHMDSNRIGYRLEGRALNAIESIPSLPCLVGAIQVPPSGLPIVTLNDGPTVGGYPVIAVLESSQIGAFCQYRPGESLKFSWYE